MKKLIGLLVAFFCLATMASAQAKGTGAYAFASFDNRGFDSVNIGNLNVRFSIPIVNKPGRGTGFNYALQYEGLIWSVDPSTNSWVHDPAWGLSGVLNGTSFTGYLTYIDDRQTCSGPSGNHGGVDDVLTNFVYHDAFGGVHSFDYTADQQDCPDDGAPSGQVITGSGGSSDGSGYTLVDLGTVQSRNGTVIHPHFSATDTSSASIVDSNGNQISANGSGGFTDTLGTTPLTVSGSSPVTFTYPVTRQADGSTAKSAVLSYQVYNVQTNFGCGAGEYSQTGVSLPDRFTYPDGSYYQFTYEPTYGSSSGSVTGRLKSVTLPTGGTISYSYSGGCNGAGINPDGTVGALTRTTSDGTRTYGRVLTGSSSTTTLTDEKNNQSVYQFVADTTGAYLYETNRNVYQGTASGTPLIRQYTCSNQALQTCASPITLPITSQWVTTSPDGRQQVLVENSYDGSGSLLTESYIYGQQTSSTSYNNLGEPLVQTTLDSSGSLIRRLTYNYDEGTPIATSSIPQHGSSSTLRGNLTSTSLSLGSSSLNTSTTYYDTGMPASTTAADGGVTTYSYDSTQGFVTGTNLPVPASGVAMSTGASYDAASAALLSTQGVNGESWTVNHYDSLMTPSDVTLASGSRVTTSNSPNLSDVAQVLDNNSGRTAEVMTERDAYGRVDRTAVKTGQGGNAALYQTDYCYDASGLLRFQSSKYAGSGFGTAKHCSGSGTSYLYDALGRVTQVTTDDGASYTQYLGRAVRTQDVNGVQRMTQYDLLGRISAICEISSNPVSGLSPSNCGMDIDGSGYLTTYSYDLANHKMTISQDGQIRVFQQDAAGRVISITEPERGTTTYSYSNGGDTITRTRPKANQTNPSVTTNTVFSYDTLGRLNQIGYDDGTPAKYLYYDSVPSWLSWSTTPVNTKGRLSGTLLSGSSYTTRSQYAYDLPGDIVTAWQCAPSICGTGNQEGRYPLQFSYDLGGNLMSYFDGASGTVAYDRSAAEEITSVTNLPSNAYNPSNLVSNVVNTQWGPTSWSLGNGLNVTKSYDTLGRNNGNYLCQGSNCSNEHYGNIAAYIGSRVVQMCDTVVNQCQSHTYDEFNRLSGVNSSGTSFTYSYDRWGNRTQQTGSPSVTFNFDGANHNTSFAYDAAGNQMTDGVHSYTYDAEGRVVAVDGGATAKYVYDALDNRIQAQVGGNTTEYIYDPSGRRISTWLVGSSYGPNGFGNEGRIYWDSGLLANRAWNGSTYFHHADWQGTERMRTDYQGNVANTQTSRAFGDGFSQTSSDTQGAAQDNNQFTSQEQDAESGTVHFRYRQYSSTQGRWMSPDPYAGSYKWRNPQSFNRYAYVLNNPYSRIDPSGLEASSCMGDEETDPECGGDSNGDGGVSSGGGGGGSGPGASGPSGCVQGDYTACVSTCTVFDPCVSDPEGSGDSFGGWGESSGGPGSGGGAGASVAPSNFQRMPLPGNHLNCTTSTGTSFPAPPGFSVSNIAANGAANGLSGAGAAVGQGGYYDFQRFQVGSVTQFFKGYTPVANVAVGAYIQGTGAPQWMASLISNTYAFFNSNNGATAQQAQFRNLGYSLAAGKASYSCQPSVP